MTEPLCLKLDDYLGNELSAAERATFVAHLADCSSCRQEAQDYEHLRGLLQPALIALEPVPPGLVNRLECVVRKSRRRRRVGWAASAAAAVLLSLAGWALMRRPAPDQSTASLSAKESPASSLETDPRKVVSIQVRTPSRAITIPAKTQDPHVTILWIYPVVHTSHLPRANSPSHSLSKRSTS